MSHDPEGKPKVKGTEPTRTESNDNDLELKSIGWRKSEALSKYPKVAPKKNEPDSKHRSSLAVTSSISMLLTDFDEEVPVVQNNRMVNYAAQEQDPEADALMEEKAKADAIAALHARVLSYRAKGYEVLEEYLARVPKDTLVVEVASRTGTEIAMLARKFPSLFLQPTEGTGGTSHSHFAFIEQNVLAVEEEIARANGHDKRKRNQESRLLMPRYLDIKRPTSWGLDALDHISCIFCIDALQYEAPASVSTFLTGCSRVLKRGGFIFVSGPFVDNGEASDVNFALNVSLQYYATKPMERTEDLKLGWGLHDVVKLKEQAASLGLELLEKRPIFDEWLALVFRKL